MCVITYAGKLRKCQFVMMFGYLLSRSRPIYHAQSDSVSKHRMQLSIRPKRNASSHTPMTPAMSNDLPKLQWKTRLAIRRFIYTLLHPPILQSCGVCISIVSEMRKQSGICSGYLVATRAAVFFVSETAISGWFQSPDVTVLTFEVYLCVRTPEGTWHTRRVSTSDVRSGHGAQGLSCAQTPSRTWGTGKRCLSFVIRRESTCVGCSCIFSRILSPGTSGSGMRRS
jgi:hypothetical protein